MSARNNNDIRDKINQKKKSAVSEFFRESHIANEVQQVENEGNSEVLEQQVNEVSEQVVTEVVNEVPEQQEKRSHNSLESTIDTIVNSDDAPEKLFRGFYLDKDVVNTIEKLANKKKSKKGFKSEFVNGILRAVLTDYGLLKNK